MDWKQKENGYNNGPPPPPNSPAMADYTAGYNQKNADAHAASMAAKAVPNLTPGATSGGGGGGGFSLGGSSSAAGGLTGTGPMDLNGFQVLMLILGMPVGFVIGVIPFFIRGLGFYSPYPKEVGIQTAIIGALVFWAVSLMTKRGGGYPWGGVTILAFACLVAHFMPTPFLALYKSLLQIH